MTSARREQTATLLPSGVLFVAAGYVGVALASTELYGDPLPPPPSIYLADVFLLPSRSFQFDFTNTPGATFTVLQATNAAHPSSEWTRLGPATEVAPGHFQFTAPNVTGPGARFYRISEP